MLLFLFHNIPRTNHCPLNRTRTFPPFSRQPPLSETNRTIPVRRTSAPCILHAHTPASRLPYVRFPDFAIIRPPIHPANRILLRQPYFHCASVWLRFSKVPRLSEVFFFRSYHRFHVFIRNLFFPFRFVCPVTMGGGYEFFGWFR